MSAKHKSKRKRALKRATKATRSGGGKAGADANGAFAAIHLLNDPQARRAPCYMLY